MRDRRFVVVSTLLYLLSGSVFTTTEAGCFDWLFHRNKSQPIAQTTPPATAPRTVAAYPPQTNSSCGPGWCQQTVVRYMPQIAYRTVYQPVPVTTYRTSTSINPTNGLPRTCTRPCTSYQYQARRVPYTTYQPVYTTVPVSDPLAANQSSAFAPVAPTSNATPWRPAPAAYQSGYASSPSCNGCSQPGAQASPWTSSPPASYGSSSMSEPAGATEWQPLNQAGGPPSGAPYGSAAPSAGQSGQAPADLRPALKPPTSGPVSVPEPKAVQEQREAQGKGEAEIEPQKDDVTDFNRIDRPRVTRNDHLTGQVAESNSLFETPARNSSAAEGNDEPALEPPSNRDVYDGGSALRYRAIRDVHRRPMQPQGELNDRTAATSKRGRKPLMQVNNRTRTNQTRYAAIPKQWQPAPLREVAKPWPVKPTSPNGWTAR